MTMPATTAENIEIISNKLDNLMNVMEISELSHGFPPLSFGEKNAVKIQLLIAQIIAHDISALQNNGEKKSTDALAQKLIKNWKDNISDFLKIILANPSFQINVDQILGDCEEMH